MAIVNYNFSVQVNGGPRIGETGTVNVEAYDVLEVALDPGATDLVVDVQPGASGLIKLLAISCDLYSGEIGYKVVDAGGDKGPFKLDAPQLFAGSAVGIFGASPKSLKFSNSHATNKAVIKIFVGRDATP